MGTVEMVSLTPRPNTIGALDIYRLRGQNGQAELQLESHDRVEEVVSRISRRLEATASKVSQKAREGDQHGSTPLH